MKFYLLYIFFQIAFGGKVAPPTPPNLSSPGSPSIPNSPATPNNIAPNKVTNTPSGMSHILTLTKIFHYITLTEIFS